MAKIAKIKWFYLRWLSMNHPQEDFYRVRQFIQSFILDKFNLTTPYLNSFFWKFDSCSVYNNNSLSQLNFKDNFDFNEFTIYELNIENVLEIDNWRKDYKNSISSNKLHVSKIYPQDFSKFGDIRYVYSLSRFHHFPFLALKSFVQNDNNLASKLFKQILEWESQNPFLNSINWKSGIEVGIRSVNLIYTRRIFSLMDQESANEVCSKIDSLLEFHFYFLVNHLSLYSSANNHLLFELLGIFLITSHYNFKGSLKWRNKSYSMLNSELFIQTFQDGFSKEQASHYHAEVLNIYSLVFAQAKISNLPIPELSIIRLNSMKHALTVLRRGNSKHLIPIGDNDEGQILFPYFDPNFNLYDSLDFDVNLINSNSFSVAGSDFRNFLIWGSFVGDNNEILPNTLKKLDFFKDSGYLFVNDKNVSVVFDFGSLGFGQLAAHGHSDILQFILYVDDQAFFVDPGTFQYHERFSKLRNYFRGSSAHNTVSISGYDQGKSGGRMLWNIKPNVEFLEYQEGDHYVNCTGSHDGFLKQGLGLTHTRKFSYNFENQLINLDDLLLLNKKKTITCNLNFHIHPDINVINEGDYFRLVGKKSSVILENDHIRNAKLISGNHQIPLGLYSSSFDSIKDCTVINIPISIDDNISIQTKIKLVKNINDQF